MAAGSTRPASDYQIRSRIRFAQAEPRLRRSPSRGCQRNRWAALSEFVSDLRATAVLQAARRAGRVPQRVTVNETISSRCDWVP